MAEKKAMKTIKLQPGDIVAPAKSHIHATAGKYCVTSVDVTCGVISCVHILESKRVISDACKWRRVLKLGPDLEQVAKVAGLTRAIIACQDHLPEGFLPTLITKQLMTVYGMLSGYANFDMTLKKILLPLLEGRGAWDEMRKEKQQPLTAAHVREVCKFGCGQEACSFGMLGLEKAECAKSDPEAEGYITMRRFAGNMVAQGDNCVGRTGRVSTTDIHKS